MVLNLNTAKYWRIDVQPAARLSARNTRQLQKISDLDYDGPTKADVFPDGIHNTTWRKPLDLNEIQDVIFKALKDTGGKWRFVPYGRDCSEDCEWCGGAWHSTCPPTPTEEDWIEVAVQ